MFQQALRSRQQLQLHGDVPDSTLEIGQRRETSASRTSARASEHRPPRPPGERPSAEHRRQRRPSHGDHLTPPAPEEVSQRRSAASPHRPASVPTSAVSTGALSTSTRDPNRRESPSAERSLSSPAPSQPGETAGAFKRNLSFFQRAAHGLHVRMSQSVAEAARRSGSVDSDAGSSLGSSSSDRTEPFGGGRFGGVTSQPTRAAPDGSGAADGGVTFRAERRAVGGGSDGADGGTAFGTSGTGGAVTIGGTAAARIRRTLRSREQQWEDSPLWSADSGGEERRPLLPDRRRSDADPLLPPRRPHLQLQTEQRRSCEDLTAFGRPSRVFIPSRSGSRGEGLTRTRSCENGLNQSPLSAPPLRTGSVSALVTAHGGDHRSQFILRRAPSVDEVLDSVKDLRLSQRNGTMMEREHQQTAAEYQNVLLTSAFQPAFQSSKSLSTKVSIGGSGAPSEPRPDSYQNVWVGAVDSRRPSEVIYDRPVNSGRKVRAAEHDQLYENVHWSGAPTYENVALTDAPILTDGVPEYDVPRSSRVYDTPRAAAAVATSDGTARSGDTDSDWDEDSLDGDLAGRRDVPSPGESSRRAAEVCYGF